MVKKCFKRRIYLGVYNLVVFIVVIGYINIKDLKFMVICMGVGEVGISIF